MGIICNQSSPRFAKIGAILFSTARMVFVMCLMGPEIRLERNSFVFSQAAFRQPGDSALSFFWVWVVVEAPRAHLILAWHYEDMKL